MKYIEYIALAISIVALIVAFYRDEQPISEHESCLNDDQKESQNIISIYEAPYSNRKPVYIYLLVSLGLIAVGLIFVLLLSGN